MPTRYPVDWAYLPTIMKLILRGPPLSENLPICIGPGGITFGANPSGAGDEA